MLAWGLCVSDTLTLQAAAQVGSLADGQQPEGGGLEADPEGRPDEWRLPEQRPGDAAGERARLFRLLSLLDVCCLLSSTACRHCCISLSFLQSSEFKVRPSTLCPSRPAALTRSLRRPGNTPSLTSSAPPRWGNSRSSSFICGNSRVALTVVCNGDKLLWSFYG